MLEPASPPSLVRVQVYAGCGRAQEGAANGPRAEMRAPPVVHGADPWAPSWAFSAPPRAYLGAPCQEGQTEKIERMPRLACFSTGAMEFWEAFNVTEDADLGLRLRSERGSSFHFSGEI